MTSIGVQTTMRVAIVSLYPLDPAHIAGGMRAAVYNLVQALTAFADLDVHVIYCHDEVTYDHVTARNGATIHYLTLPRRRLFPNYIRSLLRISAAVNQIQPDVVHAHTSHFAIPALRAGLPTVLTLHGVTHREAAIYNRTLYDRLRYGLALLYDRYSLSRVQDIVAISPYIMREYAGRTRARFHRIDNPLPAAYFELERAEQPLRLLYAGTITPLKDIMTLLRALVIVRERWPGVCLHVAGRTVDRSYEQQLRQFVTANSLERNVEFSGLLDTSAMLREYAACAMVVLPSRQEVLPMTIIEAMAAGAPVVATRAGGLGDLVADGETGLLVDVGDHATMADAIVRLLADSMTRQEMGRRGRTVAESRFRAEVVAGRYRQLYYQVAGGREGD